MSKSTISAILAVLVFSRVTCDAILYNSSTFIVKCQTAFYDLLGRDGSVQCAGCLEYQVQETLVQACSTATGLTTFDYTYKCLSCVPDYTINPVNSSVSRVYSNMNMGGADVSFFGDCIGNQNMTAHELDSDYENYDNYSQILECSDSIFPYNISSPNYNDTFNTSITCGHCSDINLSRRMTSYSCNNCSDANGGLQNAKYTYMCVECEDGYVLSTQPVSMQYAMYGNISIDTCGSCKPAPTNNSGNGEYRQNVANLLAYFMVLCLAGLVAVLN